jgi:hypothetical protein
VYGGSSRQRSSAAKSFENGLQAFLIEAVKQNRRDTVRQFFEAHADDLIVRSPDASTWQKWCTLAYIQSPWEHEPFKARRMATVSHGNCAMWCA